MTGRQRMMVAGIIVVAVIAVSTTGFTAEPLKVKGFYIGMSIDDALKNFEKLGFDGLSIRENKYQKTDTYYSIRPGSGDQFRVQTDLNVRTVSKIYFSAFRGQ